MSFWSNYFDTKQQPATFIDVWNIRMIIVNYWYKLYSLSHLIVSRQVL